MILLDTDHLSVLLDERSRHYASLNARLQAVAEPVVCTVVNVEEIFRGWMAIIHRLSDVHRQIPAYARLASFFKAMTGTEIIAFDQRAADQFVTLRRQRIRIGTMDLKIASIAMVHDSLLITANLRDFSQVPGLRCENWLKP
jgi:tRNA(fMet)-specific endonuclease VapC